MVSITAILYTRLHPLLPLWLCCPRSLHMDAHDLYLAHIPAYANMQTRLFLSHPFMPLSMSVQPTHHLNPIYIISHHITPFTIDYFCRAIFEHNHGFLMQTLKGSGMPKLMNIQMELRKCCNHPFLINGVEQNEMVRTCCTSTRVFFALCPNSNVWCTTVTSFKMQCECYVMQSHVMQLNAVIDDVRWILNHDNY